MGVTKHGDYLIKITRMGAFNCYLVREDDGFTLVDTGMSGSERSILAAANDEGLSIVRITITHAHTDHIGSLVALHQALPDAEISISAREARFMSGDCSLDEGEPHTEPRSMAKCPVEPTRLLQPGDYVGSLEVIPVPGHTPGHIAFFDHRDGTLIVGDSMQTAGGVAVAGAFKLLFPFPALATWDKALALESARTLRALNPKRLAPGHGRVLENPVAAMEQAIAEANLR
ncbi:MAG: MBL fold metallo-hydrolase [Anaerolineae bacterium]|nr:MBL fold metallo-hydrolase [Anaerolineae bacterium]